MIRPAASGDDTWIIVLDLGLPDIPGEEVAREVTTVCPTPMLMLTATRPDQG